MKQNEFIDLVTKIKRATFITFKSATDVKLPKGNALHGRLKKVSEVNAQINFNYKNAVNNRRKIEGKETDFETSGRTWGTKDGNCSIIENKGIKYLNVRVLKSLDASYLLDGKPVKKEDVAQHLPAKKSSSDKQDLEKEVIVRTYTLSNIKEVTINGNRHLLED